MAPAPYVARLRPWLGRPTTSGRAPFPPHAHVDAARMLRGLARGASPVSGLARPRRAAGGGGTGSAYPSGSAGGRRRGDRALARPVAVAALAALVPEAGVVALASGAPLCDCLADLEPRDLVVLAWPEDEWAPEALAIAGVAAMRDDSDLFYADEESAGDGAMPRLKPDWSPVLAQSIDLIGRAWFARVGWARAAPGVLAVADLVAQPAPISVGVGARVTHISRVLLAGAAAARPRRVAAPPAPRGHLCASIII